MPAIRCDNVNPLLWAYVSEYSKKRRVGRCKGLEKIIEEHMRFAAMAHEAEFSEKEIVGEKTKKK